VEISEYILIILVMFSRLKDTCCSSMATRLYKRVGGPGASFAYF